MSMHRSSFSWLSALVLTAALLWAAPTAQAQQAGYINQEAILSQMPSMQQAQEQLQEQIQSERQELQTEQQELQQQVQRFQEQSELMSEENRQQRQQELQQRNQQLQQSMQQRDQQIAQRERELMRPVFEEFQAAVDAVASNQNLDFVIRDQALLYINDTAMVDITGDVASRLGVQLQQQAGGGAPASNGR